MGHPCGDQTNLFAPVQLPAHTNYGIPGLWIQTHVACNNQPIKCVDHNQFQVVGYFISGEESRTDLIAIANCSEVVVAVAFDVDVIARDALWNWGGATLRGYCRQVLDAFQVNLQGRKGKVKFVDEINNAFGRCDFGLTVTSCAHNIVRWKNHLLLAVNQPVCTHLHQSYTPAKPRY